MALLLEGNTREDMCHGTTPGGGAVAHDPSHVTSQHLCHGTGSWGVGLSRPGQTLK